MLSEEQYCYLSLTLLSSIISADHYLGLDRVGTLTNAWSERWRLEIYTLGEYLDDELLEPLTCSLPISVQSLEKLSGSILDRWIEVFRSSTQQGYMISPDIDEQVLFYYYFCRSIAEVLVEFDHVMQEFGDGTPKFHERYLANKDKFEALAEALRNEKPDPNVKQLALLKDIEEKAKLLVTEWRESIDAAARGEYSSE